MLASLVPWPVIKNATPSIFADDTGLMAASESFPHLKNLIEEDIQSLVKWLANNKLTLNVLKTEFLIIGSKTRLSRLEDDFIYFGRRGVYLQVTIPQIIRICDRRIN